MFRVHSVSQRPNLRHLGEPLGGAECLLEAVSFKKATEGMGRGRVANTRWELLPHSGGCNTKTTGGKGSADTRNGQQVSVCRAQRTYGGVVIQKAVKVSWAVTNSYYTYSWVVIIRASIHSIYSLSLNWPYNTMQGCSLGLERLGLEMFFWTSRSRLYTATPMSRSRLGLEPLTSRYRLGIIRLVYIELQSSNL